MPHRTNRQRVASVLAQDESYLWPDAFSDTYASAASRSEVMTVYPNRGSVPASLWHSLFGNATQSIDILAFAASFLHDTLPDVDEMLIEKARAGIRVGLVFGDPDSEAVRIRGVEEGIGDSLAERCRLTWKYLEPVMARDRIAVERTGRRSIARCSASTTTSWQITTSWRAGQPLAGHASSPSRRGAPLDHHLKSFERVWSSASARDQ